MGFPLRIALFAFLQAVPAQAQDKVEIDATAAYQRGGAVSKVQNAEATFDVTRITVVGVYTVNGLERSEPTEFFTLISREESSSTVGQRP